MTPYVVGISLGLLGAMCFSAKAIVVKLAYQYEVNAVTLLTLRMLLASPLFIVVLVWQAFQKRKQSVCLTLKPNWRDYGFVTMLGLLGYYLASLFDFIGLQYISAGLERLILFAYPSLVLIMVCLKQHKWPSSRQFVGLVIVYMGLLVVYWHELQIGSGNTAWGVFWVFTSALCYASYLFLAEPAIARMGTIWVTCWASLTSSAAILVHYLLTQDINTLFNLPQAVWGLSTLNAVICTFIPVFAIMLAIERLGSAKVSQLGMIGPISTLAMGVFILEETMTTWNATGACLVLLGITWLHVKNPFGSNKNKLLVPVTKRRY